MVNYKGRSSLKQYMPMKPIKPGSKVWVIACTVTGYCPGLSICEGTGESICLECLNELPVYVKIIFGAFEGLGYCFFFDNFFRQFI